MCAAIPQPQADFNPSFPLLSSPGAFPVSAHRSQLPEGPGGVFPRHPHQQELPERSSWGSLLSCTECFQRKLTLPSKSSPSSQQIQPSFPGNPALLPGLPPSCFLCPHLPNLLFLFLFFFFLKMHFFGGYHVSSVMPTLLMRRGFFLASAELRFG